MKVFYTVPGITDDETIPVDLAGEWCITRPLEQKQIIEECAKDYWHNHDGWEENWPLDIVLHDGMDGNVIAKFTVDMEAEPTFFIEKRIL